VWCQSQSSTEIYTVNGRLHYCGTILT